MKKSSVVFVNRGKFPILVAVLGAACFVPTLARADWTGYGGDPQHTAVSAVGSQPLYTIKWTTQVDLDPRFSGSSLLIHYGSPSITANNTVIVPVKTTSTGGFEIRAFSGTTGASLWTQTTDYTLPPDGGNFPTYYGWLPSYGPSLATATNTIYYAGAGGTVYSRSALDDPGSVSPAQTAFYGIANYQASQAAKDAFNANIAICTPITSDPQGNIYFGYSSSGAVLPGVNGGAPLTSGIARIGADGSSTYFQANDLAFNNVNAGMHQIQTNSAPAITQDGTALYVTMNASNGGVGMLVKLDAATLTPVAGQYLRDPLTNNNGAVLNLSTASPMIGPDGDVYMGVQDDENTSRGWLNHFSGDLQTVKAPGGFGWDITPSVVPASMVPSYHGTSAYLLMCKYNNYLGLGGDGINMIAILDPNDTQPDTRFNGTGIPIMKEILTIASPTSDGNPSHPDAVTEWCINTAAVDPLTGCILVNNEDGILYRWNLATNTLSEMITLTGGLGEAYTPTLIGPDGTVYAINAASLYAVGALPGDANGDGRVTIDDYLAIDYGYINHLKGWANGDFTGDGTIDMRDFALIDAAFGLQGTNSAHFGESAVPEPATLGIIAAGTAALLFRRQRR